MKARVQKWGNSLAVRIPKSFADEAGLQADSTIELKLIDRQIIVVRIEPEEYDLDKLLSTITEENLHREIDTGPPAGNEVW
jgi:antitoxin MazE